MDNVTIVDSNDGVALENYQQLLHLPVFIYKYLFPKGFEELHTQKDTNAKCGIEIEKQGQE